MIIHPASRYSRDQSGLLASQQHLLLFRQCRLQCLDLRLLLL
jgi:hypothetical protein